MTTLNIIYNAKCLKCNIVESEMVRIGAFVMCQGCFERELLACRILILSQHLTP